MAFSVGKIFSIIVGDIKAVGHWLTKQQQSVPAIEAKVLAIESVSKRLLGDAMQAVLDGGEAVSAHGVNIAVDVATVADLKALILDLKDELSAFGVKLP